MREISDEGDAAREYYATSLQDSLEDSWADQEAAERQRERMFNRYAMDRANGLTHEEAGDECRSLAEEFLKEYEAQIARYRKALGKAA